MPDLLSRLGYSPVFTKKGGREYWYRSPLRSEKTPSFHITYKHHKQIWVWNDFGERAGGNLLDFLMRYRKEGLGEVLKYLRTLYSDHGNNNKQGAFFTFHQQGQLVDSFNVNHEVVESSLELVRAIPIRHPMIIQYLEKTRMIPKSIFQKHLLEIHYWNRDKDRGFFAFGMSNNSNGYEIRSASDQHVFKSALNSRDVTYYKGRAGDNHALNVFEGMLDYLSLLTLLKTVQLNADTIILHSTSSYQKSLEFIQQGNYQVINTFLDNDSTGQKFSQQFISDTTAQVTNQSVLFAGYKDLNEALTKGSNFALFPLGPRP